ncbi:TonB-dependent siderophore receptor [Nitrobacter sp.]|uniref:TonB-dependent siderophore receptor n=1 Tax=Nitrobacter sp. TaxID=29420 RepID=UPI0029CAC0C3|nr:TonB-dependent siderophore receptor [Nitrobacter sp.]
MTSWLLASTILCCASAVLSSPSFAQQLTPASAQSQAVQFSIPAQPLPTALDAFIRATGWQIGYSTRITDGHRSAAVNGTMPPAQALRMLLAGTGINVRLTGANTATLINQNVAVGGVPDGAISLETIDVQGAARNDPGRTEGTGSYTPSVTATATRLQLTPRETPQSISVVTRQLMNDFKLGTVSEVLDQTPGISAINYENGRREYFARGFAIQNLQYDGMPSFYNVTYPAGEGRGDTAIYDRIEVLKGATGLMSLSGDPSATINMIRKKPTSIFQGHTTLSAGSWNDYRGELDLSGPLNKEGTVRGRFVTAHRDAHSYLNHVHQKDAVVYGVLEADLTPNTMLTVGADYQNYKPEGMYQSRIIYFNKNGNFNFIPDRSFNPVARWSIWEETTRSIFSTLEHHFDNGWYAKLQLRNQVSSYDSNRGGAVHGNPDPIDGSGVSVDAAKFTGTTKSNAADFYATGPFQLFDREHSLVFGGSISHRRWRDVYAEDLGDPLFPVPNYYTWDGNMPKPDWSIPGDTYLTDEITRESGFYATARLNLHDKFKVIVGSRLANYERLQDSVVQMKASNVVVPYVGAIYDLTENISAYASYTEIFKPQFNKDEQGNTLDPQTGKNYEAGLKGEFFNKRLNASAAYFIIQQDNYPVPTGGMTPRGDDAYRGVDGVRTEGFEIEVSGHLTSTWQLHGGFTHSISRQDGVRVSTNVPANQAALYTTYKLDGALTGFTLGGGVRWMDKISGIARSPVDGRVPITAPSYWVVDAMASYKFNDKLTATLNIRNLTDQKYYTIMGTAYGTYTWGAPRSVYLSMRYTF